MGSKQRHARCKEFSVVVLALNLEAVAGLEPEDLGDAPYNDGNHHLSDRLGRVGRLLQNGVESHWEEAKVPQEILSGDDFVEGNKNDCLEENGEGQILFPETDSNEHQGSQLREEAREG